MANIRMVQGVYGAEDVKQKSVLVTIWPCGDGMKYMAFEGSHV